MSRMRVMKDGSQVVSFEPSRKHPENKVQKV